MAQTKHREPNRARWVGVRPAHDGEQIAESAAATNVQTTIIYTVPAGYILLLFQWSLDCAGAATNTSSFLVRNASDVIQYNLWTAYFVAAGRAALSSGLFVPIEITAGFDVVVSNTVAASYTRAFIHGLLIPVGTV